MNKVLLFGGTGEGRALAEWMVARDKIGRAHV